jgi:hypothetical protein
MVAITDLVLYHYPVTRSARVLWLLHELVNIHCLG